MSNQSTQKRQYDSFGPHFRIETGNPQLGVAGNICYNSNNSLVNETQYSNTENPSRDSSNKNNDYIENLNSSQKGNVSISEDQVELQPDEKTAASKVG